MKCAASLRGNFVNISEFVVFLDSVAAADISKPQQLQLPEKIQVLKTTLFVSMITGI